MSMVSPYFILPFGITTIRSVPKFRRKEYHVHWMEGCIKLWRVSIHDTKEKGRGREKERVTDEDVTLVPPPPLFLELFATEWLVTYQTCPSMIFKGNYLIAHDSKHHKYVYWVAGILVHQAVVILCI